MSAFLGIDTSNYTTSSAIYTDNIVIQNKKLLPVKDGAVGLRQSDAVFHHTMQLPAVMEKIFSDYSNNDFTAVGVSVKPRSAEGSYMPCFSVGNSVASILSSALKIPKYEFSHQQGHIMAALYSADKLSLLKESFLAFHVSGGTTEALLVTPNKENIMFVQKVGGTLDLNAGQLVDRIGVMMGLGFPCGIDLEKLAIKYNDKIKVKSTLKGNNCCLSGFENKCKDMYNAGEDKEKVAAYALAYIEQTLFDMAKSILNEYGNMPILFAGGVMSNSIIRKSLTNKLGACFCESAFSSDNAAGIAVLTYLKHCEKSL